MCFGDGDIIIHRPPLVHKQHRLGAKAAIHPPTPWAPLVPLENCLCVRCGPAIIMNEISRFNAIVIQYYHPYSGARGLRGAANKAFYRWRHPENELEQS
jgi:hypothetical protein